MGDHRTRGSDMRLVLIAAMLAAAPAGAQAESNAVERTAKKATNATERTAEAGGGDAVDRAAPRRPTSP